LLTIYGFVILAGGAIIFLFHSFSTPNKSEQLQRSTISDDETSSPTSLESDFGNGYNWNNLSGEQRRELCRRLAAASTNGISTEVFYGALRDQYDSLDAGQLGFPIKGIAQRLEGQAAAAKESIIEQKNDEEKRRLAEAESVAIKVKEFNSVKENAEKGHPVAQYSLGLRYLNGDGVTKDDGVGKEWLGKASAQGNLDAKTALDALKYSMDVNDITIMAELKYAEQDALSYQYKLGIRFLNGDGVPQDKKFAKEWLERAAGNGNSDAKKALSALSL
jgi:hypothetical protein